MQNCSSLRVVEGCRPIESSQDEKTAHANCDCLQTQPPSVVSVNRRLENILVLIKELFGYLILWLKDTDITARPIPLPETLIISTSSRRRLKYWPTIIVAESLDIATPIPEKRINEN